MEFHIIENGDLWERLKVVGIRRIQVEHIKNGTQPILIKRAVKDAINGKRNIPPYVLEFAAAGSVPKNWRNLEGERYYKRIGDNDYFYKYS